MKENTVCISLKEYDELKKQKELTVIETFRGAVKYYTPSDFETNVVRELKPSVEMVTKLLKLRAEEHNEHYETKQQNKELRVALILFISISCVSIMLSIFSLFI